MTVNVLLEDSFDGHQGNDLYDPEHALYRVFRVRKQATVHEFLELLSDSLVSKLLNYAFSGAFSLAHIVHIYFVCQPILCLLRQNLFTEVNTTY